VLKSEFSDQNAEDIKYNIRAILLRFFGDILDAILRNPIGKDRENKFKEIEKEIYSLYAFHPDFDPKSPVKDNIIISYVLYGKNLYDYKELKNELTSRFKSSTERDIEEVIKEFQEDKIPANFALEILRSKPFENIQRYKNAVLNRWSDVNEQEGNMLNYDKMRAKNYEEVIEEIKRDIENLRDVYEKVIVNALNPEKAVVNYTTLFLRSIDNKKKDHIRSIFRKLQPILFRSLLAEQDRVLAMNSLYKQLSDSLDEVC